MRRLINGEFSLLFLDTAQTQSAQDSLDTQENVIFHHFLSKLAPLVRDRVRGGAWFPTLSAWLTFRLNFPPSRESLGMGVTAKANSS